MLRQRNERSRTRAGASFNLEKKVREGGVEVIVKPQYQGISQY